VTKWMIDLVLITVLDSSHHMIGLQIVFDDTSFQLFLSVNISRTLPMLPNTLKF
jgi:hypothetical protein